ncbi:hypothetical protein BBC0244_022940 [Bartonella apihabitans]|uniref:hypothetical protein n=1 Tax=Bartonella apihabitans TaxID=2750929 RepID=UPI00098F61C0|nr:hypothetical protein [Bartonella apihabitans]AQT44817.1 hypothetical protein BBC0244_011100 [Bartonella apihabitans]AQT45946.1 hypothetical protein BBC0244_022940 [Bartonella apihabitans]
MKKLNQSLKITVALFIAAYSLMTTAQAQKYSDYPASPIYTGKIAKPKLSSADGTATFKTRILEGVKQGVNYAGHYNVVVIGCGSSCTFAYVVNVKTGKIIDFPLGGEENYQMRLQYNSKSRLIKAVWNDTETTENKACVIEYLEINNDKFKKVSATRKPSQDGYCDAYMD